MSMRILVVGSGGREHALCWRLAHSPSTESLFCAPGNPGTARYAENVPIRATDIDELTHFAVDREIDLVVVGPEAPLAIGLADRLRRRGIAVFGPSQDAARIETSSCPIRTSLTPRMQPMRLSAKISGRAAQTITRTLYSLTFV